MFVFLTLYVLSSLEDPWNQRNSYLTQLKGEKIIFFPSFTESEEQEKEDK